MADKANSQFEVVVAKDRSRVELVLPADLDRAMTTAPVVRGLLEAQGVRVTDQVMRRVEQALASADGSAQRTVVARSTPPTHGEDGWVQWLVGDDAGPDADHLAPIDHRDRSHFTKVTQGEVVARMHPPTPGVDGVDVLGNPIAARAGREPTCKLGDTLLCAADGRIVAQIDGVLSRKPNRADVNAVLEVDAVDFSVGNIDFDGEVIIHGKVCDCFEVRVTGNALVEGQIEAAKIHCGGNLVARRGIATRGLGEVRVQGDLEARFLHGVDAHVQGGVTVHKEAINCELTVAGAIVGEQAVMIGGRIIAGQRIAVGAVGSDAAVPTRLVLGRIPKLELLIDELDMLSEQFRDRLKFWDGERQAIVALGNRATPEQRERITESVFHAQRIRRQLMRSMELRGQLDRKMAGCVAELSAQQTIFPGTVVCFGQQVYAIHQAIHGPVRITPDAAGAELVCRSRRGDQPLRELGVVEREDADAAPRAA